MPLPKDVAATLDWVADGVALVRPREGHAGAQSMLLDEGGDVLLVDAGLDPATRARLAPHVDVCLLTHCHVPHSHGAADFREVWAPRAEARAMQSLDEHLQTYGVAHRDRELVSKALEAAGYRPATVHKRFQPGGILKLAQHEWHLVAAPGHSRGLVCLLDPERHILFASDYDGEAAPWYGYPESDPSDVERTAAALADVPVALLLTSHAAPRRRGIKPLFRQMAETIRERDRKVLATLEHPRTLDEIVDVAPWGAKAASPLERYHLRVMVEKHLARLLEKEFVHARQDGRYHRI